jgi:hypothetical protein
MIIIGLREIDVNHSGTNQNAEMRVPARAPHHLAVEYRASDSVHFGEEAS